MDIEQLEKCKNAVSDIMVHGCYNYNCGVNRLAHYEKWTKQSELEMKINKLQKSIENPIEELIKIHNSAIMDYRLSWLRNRPYTRHYCCGYEDQYISQLKYGNKYTVIGGYNKCPRCLDVMDSIPQLEAVIKYTGASHSYFSQYDNKSVFESLTKLIELKKEYAKNYGKPNREVEYLDKLIKAEELIKIQKEHVDDLIQDRMLLSKILDETNVTQDQLMFYADNMKG